jgi:acyl-CoA synthetase (AMP-forming)/AMP-acid ligase II
LGLDAVARVATVSSPADVLRRLVASDPGRPRITVYDDSDSPTRGERVELSARVVANWVAKAANLLQEDLDVAPGTVVLLDLPPHWRTLYWAFAVWSVGGCVEVPAHRCGATPSPGVDAGTRADAEATVDAEATADAGHSAPPSTPSTPATEASVVVTDDPATTAGALEAGAHAVLVTLAALARSATAAVPAGAVDEARDLATHGDVFDAWEDPGERDPALRTPAGDTAYATLTTRAGNADRVHTATADTATFLRLALEVWAGDGSVVLGRGEVGEDVLATRLEAEGVTRRA